MILNKVCINLDSSFNEIMDICNDLVDYSVNIRYPYHIEITDVDVRLAIIMQKIWWIILIIKIQYKLD